MTLTDRKAPPTVQQWKQLATSAWHHLSILFAVLGPVVLLLAALTVFYSPPHWAADLQPDPDASEYAISAMNLLRGKGFTISFNGVTYPPRYPFGFPLIIAPFYLLLGSNPGNAIWAVYLSAAAGVIATYYLARTIAGPRAAFFAGTVILCSPTLRHWSTSVMSDITSMTLVVAVTLVTYLIAAKTTFSRYYSISYVVLSSLIVFARSLDVIVVLLNIAVLLALIIRHWIAKQYLLPIGAVLITAMTPVWIYNYVTFGAINRTGYSYWVPYWYAKLGNTFSLNYVLPHSKAGEEASVLYYARILWRTDVVLPTALVILALVGLLTGMIRLQHYTRPQIATLIYLMLTAGFYTLSYLLYFFRSERFFIPLLPVLGVGVAISVKEYGTGSGVLGIRSQLRPLTRISLSVILTIVLTIGYTNAYHTVFQQSLFYREHVLLLGQRYGIRYDVDRLIATRCSTHCVVVTPDSPVYTEFLIPNARTINPTANTYASDIDGPTPNALTQNEKVQIITEALQDNVPIYYDLRVPYDKSAFYQVMLQLGQERQIASIGNYDLYQLVQYKNFPNRTNPTPPASSSGSMQPGVHLLAEPNPVPAGKSLGTTTLTWSAGEGADGQLYVSVNAGPEQLFSDVGSGTAEAPWIVAGSTYVFMLYAGREHRVQLASVVVTRQAP